ncbi:unnamed protein product, partial [marine sediment metagenome]
MDKHIEMLHAKGAEWIQEIRKGRLQKGDWYRYGDEIFTWLPSIEDYLGMLGYQTADGLHLVVGMLFVFCDPAQFALDNWESHERYLEYFQTWPELVLAFIQWEKKSFK